MEPVCLTGVAPPCTRQYPISKKAMAATKVVETPNIIIQRGTPCNPVTRILPPDTTLLEHDCCELVLDQLSDRFTKSHPLENPEFILYTDGSSIVEEGVRKAGWAVTTMDNVIVTDTLPAETTAQVVELVALTEACKQAEGKTAKIYTDSRSAFGVTHDFGNIWKNRGFMTSLGAPLKNGPELMALLNALQLPGQVAILKMKAHGKIFTDESEGYENLSSEAAAIFLDPRPVPETIQDHR